MDASAEPGQFVYDTVPYPGPILEIMAPERLRAAGLLHGWRAPATETASLLEIGCGDGVNVLAFAAANPEARATGFDLSRSAIARGQALIRQAGLGNAKLEPGDILTWPDDGTRFDYITCHGVLTWIPAQVRPALLDLIASRLAPGGVAYMSYDALPGAAPKRAIVNFLRRHLSDTRDPEKMVAQTRALIAVLDRTQGADSSLRAQIDFLRAHLDGYDPNFFFHDWLAEHYDPVDFRGLCASLAERGLALAGSTGGYDLGSASVVDPDARTLLESLGDDPAGRLELLDLLDGGLVFHRDLIVRSDAPPPLVEDGLSELCFAYEGEMEPVETEQGRGTRYRFDNGAEAVTTDPATRAVIGRLAEADRADVPYAALVADCGLDEPRLRAELMRLCAVPAIRAHAGPQRFVRHPGMRPRASALARAMFARGTFAATLRSTPAVAGDNESRYCIVLCDGTRTREEIAAAMTERYGGDRLLGHVAATIDRFAQVGLFEA